MAPPGCSPSSIRGTAARRSAWPAGDVESEGLFEKAGRRIEEGARHGAAHVVDDDVEPAELVVRGLGERRHQVEIGQVAGDDDGATPRRLHVLRHLAELLLRAGGEHDVRPGLSQRHRGTGADAASAGGHDGDLVRDEKLVEDHQANVVGRIEASRGPMVAGGSASQERGRRRRRSSTGEGANHKTKSPGAAAPATRDEPILSRGGDAPPDPHRQHLRPPDFDAREPRILPIEPKVHGGRGVPGQVACRANGRGGSASGLRSVWWCPPFTGPR